MHACIGDNAIGRKQGRFHLGPATALKEEIVRVGGKGTRGWLRDLSNRYKATNQLSSVS